MGGVESGRLAPPDLEPGCWLFMKQELRGGKAGGGEERWLKWFSDAPRADVTGPGAGEACRRTVMV